MISREGEKNKGKDEERKAQIEEPDSFYNPKI